MSAARRSRLEPEIARGLREALDPVIEQECDVPALSAARDVAHLLLLPGLERLLGALVEHAGTPWPAATGPALDRLRRMHAVSNEQQSLEIFQAGDRELAGLADVLGGMEWAGASPEPSAPVVQAVTVTDALEGLAIVHSDMSKRAEAVQVAAPVAAALRAVLDWLAGDAVSARPLQLAFTASTLEVTCAAVDASALVQAHELIASVGGNLGPAQNEGGNADWVIRVPSLGEVPSYLMLVQGDVRLALPWQAVLRVTLAEETADQDEVPALPRLVPVDPSMRKRPAVLVAWGLKRATFDADRLVWRLQARRDDASETPPVPHVTHAVKTDDDERFWVIDVAALMESVALPPIPQIHHTPAKVRVGPAGGAEPVPSDVDPTPSLQVLTQAEVQPLKPAVETPKKSAPKPGPAPATPAPPATVHTGPPAPRQPAPGSMVPPVEPFVRSPRGNRALIAEDSLTARIFLSRLLQAQGFEVRAVERATELREELGGAWTLLCVDVELPDARGPSLVEEVVHSQEGRPTPAAVIALVRDRADTQAAAMAGVHRVLQKPYDAEGVRRMLERVGVLPARTS